MPVLLELGDGEVVDLALATDDDCITALGQRLDIASDVIEALRDGDNLKGWSDRSDDDDDDDGEQSLLADEGDLSLAILQIKRARTEEAGRLPDVLHYLTRAIPDLYPLIALLERETGRKLGP